MEIVDQVKMNTKYDMNAAGTKYAKEAVATKYATDRT